MDRLSFSGTGDGKANPEGVNFGIPMSMSFEGAGSGDEGSGSARRCSSSSSRGPSQPLVSFHILPVIHDQPHLLRISPRSAERRMNRMQTGQLKWSGFGAVVECLIAVFTAVYR